MFPVVVEIVLMILVLCVLIYSLVRDVIASGFLVWQRDAVGHLFQATICLVCILCTLLRCRTYVL